MIPRSTTAWTGSMPVLSATRLTRVGKVVKVVNPWPV
jgi:hypothetical protein